jgi:outer membrane protein OmpA-like peptidoglycan-associated protein
MNPKSKLPFPPSGMRFASALAALGVLGACATPEPSYPALQSAHSAVEAARAAPDAHYADLELNRADEFLRRADAAAAARQPALVAHFAYLAERESRIALQIGAGKAADAYVAHGDEERQRIQLAARTQELNAARAQAELASSQAQEAAAQAQEAAAQASEAEAERDRFHDELASLQAQQSARGTVITLKDMVFATGQAELQPGAERTLDTLASALKDAPQRAVAIEGFTDSTGDAAFNQALSERRADAVRDALQQRGIDSSRIVARGYGEQFPVATNATAAGRQLNRRVEIIVSDAGSQVAARSM